MTADPQSARPSWLRSDLYPFESHCADIDGALVHYVDEGSGPPLLLLHGNPTWSFLYRDLIKSLSDRYRCIAPDHPGFGLSRPAIGYGYTPAEHATVLERLIEQLDLGDVTMMVQDWGGPIGFAAATRHPDRFSAFVIGNTWAWPKSDPGTQLFSRLLGGPIGGYLIKQRNVFVEKIIPGNVKRRKLPPEVMDAYRGRSQPRTRAARCTSSRARSSAPDHSSRRSSKDSRSCATDPPCSYGRPRTSPSRRPNASAESRPSPTTRQ